MNQNDINRAFTEKVTELLSRGYQIHPGTMGGSQGEIAHVDLYKGDEIIRVLLDHSAGHGEKPDGIRLIVGRNTDRIRMNCFDKLGNTIWNNHLEILSEIEFCQIGENYYTDAESGRAIQEKRDARRRARRETIRRDLPDAFKCAALKYVQRQPRMKSCKLSRYHPRDPCQPHQLGQSHARARWLRNRGAREKLLPSGTPQRLML